MNVAGTVALVTGGVTGVGRAISLPFVWRCCAIAVKYIGAIRAAADKTVTELVACGVKATAIEAEVTDSQACRGMAAAIGVRSCTNGTCGGAWVGVVQALAGCGESCGLPMAVYRSCATSAC